MCFFPPQSPSLLNIAIFTSDLFQEKGTGGANVGVSCSSSCMTVQSKCPLLEVTGDIIERVGEKDPHLSLGQNLLTK